MGTRKQVLLGIDVGATGIKAGVFDDTGVLLASAGRRNGPVQQPGGEPGWMIWDVERLWEGVCCSAALSQVREGGRGVVRIRRRWLPWARAGAALPMISWLRPHRAPARLARPAGGPAGDLPDHRLQLPDQHYQPAARLREHEPQVLEQTYRWLMVQDYIVYRLTPSARATIASTTMGLDLNALTWSERLLSVVDVPKSIFPDINQPGSVPGTVALRPQPSRAYRWACCGTGGPTADRRLGSGVASPIPSSTSPAPGRWS